MRRPRLDDGGRVDAARDQGMDGLGETDAAEGGGGAEHPGGLARRSKPAEAMTSAGYASLQAVPMRLHDRSLGALTLLRRRAGHLAE
ncbi:hypothetical protein ACFU6M_08940 [Streptomyces bottropensis]|uniref:hypothetical protein n=1 Tax=Streptomyces bottropensis TaxID=42235 RepID=UPI0036B3685B